MNYVLEAIFFIIICGGVAFVAYEIGRSHGVRETQRRIDELMQGMT